MSRTQESTRKKVRLADVAESVEISIATASMALSGHPRVSPATRQRVWEACRRLGYRTPRQSRAQSRAVDAPACVGAIFVGTALHDPVNASLLHELANAAKEAQLHLELMAIDLPGGTQAIEEQVLASARRCRGIMLSGLVPQSLLRKLASQSVPAVVLGPLGEGEGEPIDAGSVVVVRGDDQAMGQLATQRLLRAGHQRVAFVCETIVPGFCHDGWLAGYRLAHHQLGRTPAPELAVAAGSAPDGLAHATDRLTRLPQPPTAWVVPDLRIAARVHETLRRSGVEVRPTDMIIAGEPQLAQHYHLETFPLVGLDIRCLSRVAVARLTQWVESDLSGCQIVVPHQTWNLPPLQPSQ